MKTFRYWFTPGSVVLATLVALLWLHRLPITSVGRELGQLALISLTFAGLWVLSGDTTPNV